MKQILEKLIQGQDLNHSESQKAMTAIMTGEAGEVRTASFLTALACKGATGIEIESCAKAMRKAANAWPGPKPDVLVDTCGTGGDSASTINISTLAAITLASMGIAVAKHGNRAVSGTTGSADILEALGLKMNLKADQIAKNLQNQKLAFLFAPQWHPAMKHAAPIRKQLGFRTVFNILGPLTNPAPITHQILGVYSSDLMQKVAEAVAGLGRTGALVVHSSDGLDEISPSAETMFVRIENGKVVEEGQFSAADFGFANMDRRELHVQNRDETLERTRAILKGQGKETENKTIAMNAAALYQLVKKDTDQKEAAEKCLHQINTGKLQEFVSSWS